MIDAIGRHWVADLVAHPDGGVVAVAGSLGFHVIRLGEDGAPMTSFGGDGVVDLDPAGRGRSAATGVRVTDGGDLLVAGTARRVDRPRSAFTLLRLTSAGRVDPSYGSGRGLVQTGFGPSDAVLGGIELDAAGRLIAAGWVTKEVADGPVYRYAVARYLPDGTLDEGFDVDGRRTGRAHSGISVTGGFDVSPDGRSCCSWSCTSFGSSRTGRWIPPSATGTGS